MKQSSRLHAQNLLQEVRRAADLKPLLRESSIKQRNSFLRALVAQVAGNKDAILRANRQDCEHFIKVRNTPSGILPTFALTPRWLDNLLPSIDGLAELPDPLSSSTPLTNTHDDILVSEVRVPLGMIGAVSRLRPRIMLDAIAMGVKSGNVVLVDCGSSVRETSRALIESVQRALTAVDLPHSAVVFVDDAAATPLAQPAGGSGSSSSSQLATSQWLRMHEYIDVGIVCGANRLFEFTAQHATMPLIRATGHVCSLYVDKDADFSTALKVVENSKFQRLTATNSINNLLIHHEFARRTELLERLAQKGAILLGDAAVNSVFPVAGLATEEDWIGVQNGSSGFQRLCVRFVSKGMDEVVGFLSTYGSGQSDGIISTNTATIETFLRRVDSACVFANVSTRFSSGSCFGFGADMAVATSRMHCRGPISMKNLTTSKYVVRAVDIAKGATR
jgi:glutamate-5-semialdehyde dehydrogenase